MNAMAGRAAGAGGADGLRHARRALISAGVEPGRRSPLWPSSGGTYGAVRLPMYLQGGGGDGARVETEATATAMAEVAEDGGGGSGEEGGRGAS